MIERKREGRKKEGPEGGREVGKGGEEGRVGPVKSVTVKPIGPAR